MKIHGPIYHASLSAQTVLGMHLVAGATNAYPKQFEHLN